MYALTAKAMRYMDEYTIGKGMGGLLMRLFLVFLTRIPNSS